MKGLRFGLAVFVSCADGRRATRSANGRDRDPAWPGEGRAGQRRHEGARHRDLVADRALARDCRRHAGVFVLADLPPGTVSVLVAADGFAEQRYTDVPLRVGQTFDLPVALAVAGVKESVSVAATSLDIVNTTSSVVDAVITAPAIEKLPLNGRNFLELSLLVPGNAPAPNFDPTKTSSVLISSAGQFGRGGNITIDGMDNNDDVVGGPLMNIAQDSVQEFQIATSRFSAELGRSAGSVINVVTRSGGESTHGSGAIYWRDSSLQSLPATYDRSAGSDFPFDREQLAGSVGGPIRKSNALRLRRHRISQPGRRGARRHAQRRDADDHEVVRHGACRRSARTVPRRLARELQQPRDAAATPARTSTTPARRSSTARSARPRSGSAARTTTTASWAPGRPCCPRAA